MRNSTLPPSLPTVSSIETLTMALNSLRSNQLRTGLTMLGVIIGIASVIAITSIGQGVKRSTEQQLESLGTNILTVQSGAARAGSGILLAEGSATTLTLKDAQAIAQQAPSVMAVAAFLRSPTQVVNANINLQTTAVGTEINFPSINNYQLQSGRFFTQAEMNRAERVVVLGHDVWEQLFKDHQDPLNQIIRIKGERFTVIGVMAIKGSSGPQNNDDQVFLPLTTMSARIIGINALKGISVNGIWIQGANQKQLEAAQFQITNLLRLRHQIKPPQVDDFNITNQADLIKTFSTILSLLTLMVSAVGGISLLVGGIGIANIMLVTVVERTREIGIRKALGATSTAILSQFLVESVMISLVGGGLGILFGLSVSTAVAWLVPLPLVISGEAILWGVGLSVTIGLVAGVIPARNASRLDPITALRSE